MIDFENAFDNVWCPTLWFTSKLIRNNIDGKCFRIFQNLYQGIPNQEYVSIIVTFLL